MMLGKYQVAHLLGITRDHEERFREVERKLTCRGFICFAPAIYDYDVYDIHADMLDDMCYAKLMVCDLCVVVTPEHIGKSTTARILQALKLNRPVWIWQDHGLKTQITSESDLKMFKSQYDDTTPQNR